MLQILHKEGKKTSKHDITRGNYFSFLFKIRKLIINTKLLLASLYDCFFVFAVIMFLFFC